MILDNNTQNRYHIFNYDQFLYLNHMLSKYTSIAIPKLLNLPIYFKNTTPIKGVSFVIFKDYAQIITELQQFNDQQLYLNPFMHQPRTYNFFYLALFSRSCLISEVLMKNRPSYQKFNASYGLKKIKQEFKKHLPSPSSQNHKLTLSKKLSPLTATILMQLLTYFKFEGDQQKIIQQLCAYYENNHYKFNRKQQHWFWQFYMKLMSHKVHERGPLKFRNLQRMNDHTRQSYLPAVIIQKEIKCGNIKPHKHITSIKYIKDNTITEIQFNIKVKKINVPVNLRILAITSPKQNEREPKTAISRILTQISEIDKMAKKGWTLLFHNNIKNSQISGKNPIIDEIPNGKIRIQKLQKYLASESQYLNGIYYNNSDFSLKKQQKTTIDPILNRQIDHLTTLQNLTHTQQARSLKFHPRNIEHCLTLLLGIKEKYINTGQVYLVNFNETKQYQNGQRNPYKAMIAYLTGYQMRESLAYADICLFHYNLFKKYYGMQYYLRDSLEQQNNQLRQSLKQQFSNPLSDLTLVEEQDQQHEEQEKRIKTLTKQNSQILSALTLNSATKISSLQLTNQYFDTHTQPALKGSDLASNAHWIFEKFAVDSKALYDQMIQIIESNLQEQSNCQNNFIIITHRDNGYELCKQFLEGKFIVVPTIPSKESQLIQIEKMAKSMWRKI